MLNYVNASDIRTPEEIEEFTVEFKDWLKQFEVDTEICFKCYDDLYDI